MEIDCTCRWDGPQWSRYFVACSECKYAADAAGQEIDGYGAWRNKPDPPTEKSPDVVGGVLAALALLIEGALILGIGWYHHLESKVPHYSHAADGYSLRMVLCFVGAIVWGFLISFFSNA